MFQAPKGEDNSVESACKRLSLAVKMLQTFTSDKLKEHSLEGKTFRLEEESTEVVCHVFTSSLSLSEAHKLNKEELWSHFAVELMNSSLRSGNNNKFLAFVSFTRYNNDSNKLPLNHQQVLQMTKGEVALGGGGLALFGTGCLHTWPENVQQVPWRFGDKRKIDRMSLMDDSANRGTYWACYSTGLGATLHELGHTFDLGHTTGGIMGRGFDDIHKHFIVDMFYHDHPFQKEHNPFYQDSSIQRYTVPLTMTSPLSWGPNLKESANLCDNQSSLKNPKHEKSDVSKNESCTKKPWRLPNPPDVYGEDKFAVHVGGAYWTRSSALLLHFHKWFNNVDIKAEGSLSIDGVKISSPNGIKVIEFREKEGTSFHHLEFLESEECTVDLTKCNILSNLPDDAEEVFFVAEDGSG
ncbi:hypothetical protein JTE90_014155 [Oedothorax gibbosus]|uniref:Zinc metalloproteinase n=1 Tax=Oedothorax gibbosus TaxID=931172 RepID=A0AAV6VJ24_9ARAC|nr:hypothetical protein JTE90_014155 [Oedothorax gibbosus]